MNTARLKQQWERHARRIDALSLRERGFLFLSVALVIAALADTLVLSPALAEQKQLAAKLKTQATELQMLRAQLSAATLPPAADTPQGRLRAQIDDAQARQKALNADISRRLSNPHDMARLPHLLERTLRRHERLTLVKLATLSDAPATARASSTGLRWQGVDLAVSGQYLDLVSYLAELETALPGLRWDELSIATVSTPPQLSVRLYLVGEAP